MNPVKLFLLLVGLLVLTHGRAAPTYKQYLDSAMACNAKNQLEKATQWCKKALEAAKKSGNKRHILQAEIELGKSYYVRDNYAQSATHKFNALELAQDLKDKEKEAEILNLIGCVYYAQSDYKKSKDYFLQSTRLCGKKNENLYAANCCYLAGIFYNEVNYDSSIFYYNKSMVIYERNNDSVNIVMSLQNLASSYGKKGDRKNAENMLLEAFDLSVKRNRADEIAYSCFLLGDFYYDGSSYRQSVRYYQQGAQIFDSINQYAFAANCYFGLSNALYALGDYKNAIENYKKMVIHKDSVFNEEQTKAVTQREVSFKFEQQKLTDSLRTMEREKAIRFENNEKLKRQRLYTYFGIGGFLLMMVVMVLLLRNIKQKNKANAIIAAQKKEVELKNMVIETRNKEITDSITYAKRIQYSLLAHKELIDVHLKEYFILFKPKDIVSGDFYWATAKNNDFYLAVCDSTGHGVPGAFMSLLNISFLNEAIIEKNINEPHHVLNHVRSRLIQNMEGAKDGMDGTLIRFSGNSISYASANNRPILIRDNSIIELEADKMPVGKGELMNDFRLFTITAQKGDVLYFFTDGYADQFGGPKGKKFKYSNLNKLLLEQHEHSMEKQKNNIEEVFNQWKGDLEQIDDICIVGIKI